MKLVSLAALHRHSRSRSSRRASSPPRSIRTARVTFRIRAPKAAEVTLSGYLPAYARGNDEGWRRRLERDHRTAGSDGLHLLVQRGRHRHGRPGESEHQAAGAHLGEHGGGSRRIAALLGGARRSARGGRDQLAEVDGDQRARLAGSGCTRRRGTRRTPAAVSGALPVPRLERHGGRLDAGRARQLHSGQSAGGEEGRPDDHRDALRARGAFRRARRAGEQYATSTRSTC